MVKKNKKLKDKSLIDIGIPIYNESKNLLKTLKNLSSFKNLNIRFIIADNCSTDSSSEIYKKFFQTDKRFKYFIHKKKISSFKNFNYVFNINYKTQLDFCLGLRLNINPARKESNQSPV